MDIKPLTDTFAVSGQITAADLGEIARAGYKSIVCNRPDNEVPGQPTYDQIAHTAATMGLVCAHVPSISGAMTTEDADAMGEALDTLPAPILAYCRTGTRSTTLWALAVADEHPIEDILQRASVAGYDLSLVSNILHQRAKRL